MGKLRCRQLETGAASVSSGYWRRAHNALFFSCLTYVHYTLLPSTGIRALYVEVFDPQRENHFVEDFFSLHLVRPLRVGIR
jgi:hypothetical protein